jgi:HK97 family phage portal protein
MSHVGRKPQPLAESAGSGWLRRAAWKWAGWPVRRASLAQGERRSSATLGSLSNPTPAILELFGAGTASGVAVNDERARSISAVFACVDLLSKTVAGLPARVYRKTGKGREPQPDHPASRLLGMAPNAAQTPFQFRSFMQACLSMRGNAYALIERNQYFEPVGLRPVHPREVQVLLSSTGTPFYRYRGADLTPLEMLHVPACQTSDGFVGIAPISVMRETLGLALALQEHGARLFANGANPGGAVITTPNGTTADQVEKLRTDWDRNHKGLSNTGRPAILYGGMELKSIGFNNEDAQFLANRTFEVEEVARFHGVPLALIQSTEKTTSWGSGIAQLIEGFVKFTIMPIVINWEQKLSASLLTEAERADDFYVHLNLDGLLRGDQKGRYEAYQIGRTGGWLSANDVRRLEEMDELPDAVGGIYLMPANTVPAGMLPADNKPVPANQD